MIKLEHVVLPSPEQMEFIIEGMRNPMNSWDKSDSKIIDDVISSETEDMYSYYAVFAADSFKLGLNDLTLMQKLSAAGTDHRKFMRMMPVMVRITAPLYWWKEFDTYKVGVCPNPTDIETNSCSTMHKIQDKEFTYEDFSADHLADWEDDLTCKYLINEGSTPDGYPSGISPMGGLHTTITLLNKARERFNDYTILLNLKLDSMTEQERRDIKEKQKEAWWQLIQLLPSSYNQTRNVMLNYEVLANIYPSRKNHKLDEWVEFCKWIESLPYSELITGGK